MCPHPDRPQVSSYYYMYYYIGVLILLYILLYVSSYLTCTSYIYVLMRTDTTCPHTSLLHLLYMCPHTSRLHLLYMCPHTSLPPTDTTQLPWFTIYIFTPAVCALKKKKLRPHISSTRIMQVGCRLAAPATSGVSICTFCTTKKKSTPKKVVAFIVKKLLY